MAEYRHDTYCGLYCGACLILLAHKDGKEELIAPHFNLPPSEVKCQGCKSEIVFGSCRNCKIRTCALKKGIEFCFECKEYPCAYFTELKEQEDKKPHLKIIFQNNSIIKNEGINNWLNKQETIWKCPQCKTDFSWYTDKCLKCGNELNGLKDFNNLEDSSTP